MIQNYKLALATIAVNKVAEQVKDKERQGMYLQQHQNHQYIFPFPKLSVSEHQDYLFPKTDMQFVLHISHPMHPPLIVMGLSIQVHI